MKNSPIRPENAASGFNRRQFLRGLGACVALPAFASLSTARVLAASSTSRLAAARTGDTSATRESVIVGGLG